MFMKATAPTLILLGITIVRLSASAQDRDLIVRMTTPIEVHFTNSVPNYGSGFYFQQLGPKTDPTSDKPQWRSIAGLYLVTAKHATPTAAGSCSRACGWPQRTAPTKKNLPIPTRSTNSNSRPKAKKLAPSSSQTDSILPVLGRWPFQTLFRLERGNSRFQLCEQSATAACPAAAPAAAAKNRSKPPAADWPPGQTKKPQFLLGLFHFKYPCQDRSVNVPIHQSRWEVLGHKS